ncbi:hypothetical protein T492DRAFT_907373 [Pavlovales sp. CCMP2436]|nr:hypothetical protein T492DRAFT_907373 [Pavlovales sp. CCMP2436]
MLVKVASAYAALLPADNRLLLSVAITRLLHAQAGSASAAASLLRFVNACGYALSDELSTALERYVLVLASPAAPGRGRRANAAAAAPASAVGSAGERASRRRAQAAALEEVCAQLSFAFSSRAAVDYTLQLCCTALLHGPPEAAPAALELLRAWLSQCRHHLRVPQFVALARALCTLVASSPSATVSTAAEAVLGVMLQETPADVPADAFDFVRRFERAPAELAADAQSLVLAHVLPTEANAVLSLRRCAERLGVLALGLPSPAAPPAAPEPVHAQHDVQRVLAMLRAHSPALPSELPSINRPAAEPRGAAPTCQRRQAAGRAAHEPATGRRALDVGAASAAREARARDAYRHRPPPRANSFARGVQATVGSLAASPWLPRDAAPHVPPRSEAASSDMAAEEPGGTASADDLDSLGSSEDELSLGSTASEDEEDE